MAVLLGEKISVVEPLLRGLNQSKIKRIKIIIRSYRDFKISENSARECLQLCLANGANLIRGEKDGN